ncbi:HopJ type III effector protein [Granulosicoccaceae sp. 1_MG-2023]|nr:HopJ type III effector protein [Granulosicoccaceae sp. 1_MG-2023]
MTTTELLQTLASAPQTIEFDHVMQLIGEHYQYTPTAFKNGTLHNAAGQNEGSCKVFAFARLHNLNKEQTLALFGRYYRDDVLGNPDGQDHGNIRNFMQHGWDGIEFEGEALSA